MTPTADDISAMPGRQVIAEICGCLHDEDWRIRGSEEAIVLAGLRRRPDPEVLSRAERFHALKMALEHAARAGPKGSIDAFIKQLRTEWKSAVQRREIDAVRGCDRDDQPRDEGPDPSVAA